jgi:CheY-like chemotaxis protein
MTAAVGGVLLVVDEDERRVEHIENMLAPDGVTVLHAKTLSQSLELLQALGTACCILISMTLPARGAYTLLSRLRSDRAPESACSAILYGPKALLDSEPVAKPVIAAFPTPIDYASLHAVVCEHCVDKTEQRTTA